MSVGKVVNAVSSANDEGNEPSAPLTSCAQYITPLPRWAESDVRGKIWI